MRRILLLALAALTLLATVALAQSIGALRPVGQQAPQATEDPLFSETLKISEEKVSYSFASETLSYTISSLTINKAGCYLTRIQVAEPARQIRKVTAEWRKHLANAVDLAKKLPGCELAVNASGYVSPAYSWVPEEYPGEDKDYFFTPLGSLTVTDGTLYRELPGVRYYGLTLEADGLHLYSGADNETVLARQPSQTWSFYDGCPLIVEGRDCLDRSWDFARATAQRNILCKMSDQEYLILTVARRGLRLTECVDFLQRYIHPLWAYNLDGGPSTALLRRRGSGFRVIVENKQKNVDILAFTQ